jgi:hypothetical protein
MDSLSRPLTPTELQWLGQHSLICLGARLTPEAAAAATEDALALALARSRGRHPYLQVSISATEKAFRSAAPAVPISNEEVELAEPADAAAMATAVRAAARRQLEIGVDREQTLARVHLVTGREHTHLLLLCDHLALDAKSLTVWLGDIMAALLGGASGGGSVPLHAAPHAFVDWSERTPPGLSFEPFASRGPSVMLNMLSPAPEALAATPAPGVTDLVAAVGPAVFGALRASAKWRQTTLNAPLSAAFAAAVVDAARRQRPGEVQAPAYVQVVWCSARHLRPNLPPQLPPQPPKNTACLSYCFYLYL